MPLQLLPATAQAFAARAPPNIVLNSKVEPWLTQTLKRINRVKRPLNSVPQHLRCLTETLGGDAAIWTLTSLLLPKAPEKELHKSDNPLEEALFNYQLVHVEAYVVHVDMVAQHEVAFKLTADTIDALVDYHRDIWSVDAAANAPSWPEKDAQVKKVQEDFVQAANRYVFRTGVRALEGLEEDGAGELLDGRALQVRTAIEHLFAPLVPPPPRIVDVMHPSSALMPPHPYHPHHHPQMTAAQWWMAPTTQSLAPPLPAPVESWKVLPSTPSPTSTSCSTSDHHSSTANFWQDMHMGPSTQLPSPTPSFSQHVPFTSAPAEFYSSPQPMAPMPALHFPSAALSAHCGTDFAMGGAGGFGDFSWSSSHFPPHFAMAV